MKLFTTSTAKNANVGKLATIGCTLLVVSALIFITDPVQIIVNSQLTLKTGTLLYSLWLKPPVDVFIEVYMFNITNLDAFTRGADSKLKVEQVGPYVFQEFLENQNVTFNANNTLSYTPQRTVKFVPERSVGDPKVDRIIAPNIPYMGVTSAAAGFSAFASIAVNALARKFNAKPVIKVTVDEYLWGYDDPLVHLASKLLPSVINFERFGLMDRMFSEGHNVVTIKLPEKGTNAVNPATGRDFSIDNWNGEKGFRVWDYRENRNNTECNTLQGAYDGTLFPRQISEGESFRVYRKTFCRTMSIVYSHPGTYNGIEAYYFKLKENAFDSDLNDPESACYCKGRKCLKKGLGNITPCYYNIPLAVSLPHFLNADPSLLEPFEGLHPNEEKHGTKVMIQPQIGIPMKVHTRIQVNLIMGDIKYSSEMSRFKNMVLPIFWVEMGVEDLNPNIILLLKLLFKICPYTQLGLVILLFVVGVSLTGIALLLLFWLPVPWRSLKIDENPDVKAQVPNIRLLPLLKQPTEKLTKRQMEKMRREYDITLVPLQCSVQKGFVV